MKRKRIVSLLLSVILALSMAIPISAASTGLSNFKKQTDYSGFSDVPASAWYAESVKTVCEYGLMNGTGNGKFSPSGYVTMAETVALMSRLHIIYTGTNETIEQTSPWFITYDSYAAGHGLDAFGFSGDSTFWKDHPTRELFVSLVSQAIPMSEFQIINDICATEPTGDDATDRFMRLFNAGVITGKSDGTGFDGGSVITRSEVATILTRMIIPSQRVHGRPTYVVNDADIIAWADDAHTPGDMCYGGEDCLLVWHAYNDVTAYINGIQYNVVLDRANAGSQQPSSPSAFPEAGTPAQQVSCSYVINTRSGIFHYAWCKYVAKMAAKNTRYYTGNRDSLVPEYQPCKVCNP